VERVWLFIEEFEELVGRLTVSGMGHGTSLRDWRIKAYRKIDNGLDYGTSRGDSICDQGGIGTGDTGDTGFQSRVL